MKELPIPFSGPMVEAILEGRKSQTRRVMEFPPVPTTQGQWEPIELGGAGTYLDKAHTRPAPEYLASMWHTQTGQVISARYQVGDRLWVKETWRLSSHKNGDYCPCYQADNLCQCGKASQITVEKAKWKSGRFMFKKYARLWLEVTAVRAERLQMISYDDILSEGWDARSSLPMTSRTAGEDAHDWFITLWGSVTGKTHPWTENPWVWVYTFRRIGK